MVRRRRPREFARTALVVLCALMLTAGCGPSVRVGSDGTITLRVAHDMPASYGLVKNGVEVWMDEVRKRTGGKVEFDYYPTGQLIGAGELLSAVKSGVVHMSAFVPATSAGADLPLTDVLSVPGFTASSTNVRYRAYWDVLKNQLYEAEWRQQGIRPVASFLTGPYQLIMTGPPRRGLDGWRGRTIRTSGGAADFLVAGLESAAVTMSGAEQYEALQRGTIDSGINSLDALVPFRFYEVVDAATTNLPIGGSVAVMAIGQEVYDTLPEAVRKAMDEASAIAMKASADAVNAQLATGREKTADAVEYYAMTDGELAELDPVFTEARERWIAQREKNGLPGREIVDAWARALSNAEREEGVAPS